MPSTNSHLSLIEEQTKEILQPIFWAFMSLGAVIGAFLSIYLLSLNSLLLLFQTDPQIEKLFPELLRVLRILNILKLILPLHH